jgi:hypothetical protein
MPRVAIKTGFVAPDGSPEVLAEYICDWHDCPNIATQVLGCSKELGISAAVCDEHAPGARNAASGTDVPPPAVS